MLSFPLPTCLTGSYLISCLVFFILTYNKKNKKATEEISEQILGLMQEDKQSEKHLEVFQWL